MISDLNTIVASLWCARIIVGVSLRVFIVKTSFTDRYQDILYTFS
jgi:hypothetical protein